MNEFVALALGASHGVPSPLTEYVAPAPGVTYTVPSPGTEYYAPTIKCVAPAPGDARVADAIDEIDDVTRCLNDFEKQGIYRPMLPDLESRVAALRQARGY